jgi:hypothetical protein
MDFTMCLALTNGTVVKKKCACMTKLALWKILMATMKQTNKQTNKQTQNTPPQKQKLSSEGTNPLLWSRISLSICSV